MSPRRTSHRRGFAPAAALAALAHLMALLALGGRAPVLVQKREPDLAPPLQITLMRPPRPARPAAPASRTAPIRPPPAAAPSPSSSPPPPMLTQPAPTAPSAAAQPEAAPDGEPFRSALRGLLGCSDSAAYHLNHDERAACDQRLAAAKPAPVGPEFSAAEQAQFNADKQESMFTRKAHNGCLPHIGDRKAAAPVGGRSGSSTTFGPSCAWSF
jgi:hypothetical protein